ncbi:hypothetical protein LWI29_024433 [Acer saccharum]|uniref:RNase H type-1 domain-containing protein n=1 Tax=Acer saccharum TaxID=4024 RepID=A0AA39T628_ACESA|nr:hypothetical protein LWI29_024433 [Acer saccharum]
MELLCSKRVQSFHAVRKQEVELMTKFIARSSSQPINLSSLTLVLANNIVCRAIFGKKFDNAAGFDELMRQVQGLLGKTSIADFFPWMEWLNKFNGRNASMDKYFGELDKILDQEIHDHLHPERSKPENEDLIDVLLRIQKDSSASISLTSEHIKAVPILRSGKSGVGVIICDHWGVAVAVKASPVLGCSSVELLEAQACLEGLQLALDVGIYGVVLESDAAGVIQLLSDHIVLRTEMGAIILNSPVLGAPVGLLSVETPQNDAPVRPLNGGDGGGVQIPSGLKAVGDDTVLHRTDSRGSKASSGSSLLGTEREIILGTEGNSRKEGNLRGLSMLHGESGDVNMVSKEVGVLHEEQVDIGNQKSFTFTAGKLVEVHVVGAKEGLLNTRVDSYKKTSKQYNEGERDAPQMKN